jgi:eukaryotic-like serine/threonine-protein kinase
MVLALARPEISSIFPRLWADMGVPGLHIGALKPRAAAQLIRSVLGDDLESETVEGLIERSAGNAFTLEELMRQVVEADGDGDFPETILTMARSRLDELAPEARLVLRACALLDDGISVDALRGLLGRRLAEEDLERWLESLIDEGVLEPRSGQDSVARRELSFRDQLQRAAASSMLTDEDRRLGQLLVEEWLESHRGSG